MIYSNQSFDEERALYGISDSKVENCRFDGPADGESAFKECRNIQVEDSYFNLRYPFWHVDDLVVSNCELTEGCRAALWYDNRVSLKDCKMHGIKSLRECRDACLENCDVISPEFSWRTEGIRIQNTKVKGEYPFFECKNIEADGLELQGKYSLQYVENVHIKNANLDTKDAFWHGKNITIEDSVVKGEYLAWYSENLRFVRCKIIGTQPFCYCKNLVLEDCTMENCDLSFERSEVQAKVNSHIDSVKNPISGRIEAESIGEIILEEEIVKKDGCEIITK